MPDARPVAVVGGGIVGLAGAFHLVERGLSVVLVDRGEGPSGEEVPGASSGNAGGIAVTECVPAAVPGLWRRVPGWMLDPLGPLHVRPAYMPRLMPWLLGFLRAGEIRRVRRIAAALAALNARVYPDLDAMLGKIGLSDRLHRVGALVLYRSEAERTADSFEWEIKRAHGVRTQEIGRGEIEDLEPAVGPSMRCGVFQPDWAHVSDPGEIVRTLRACLTGRGVVFLKGEVTALETGEGRVQGLRFADGRALPASHVVLAAGAWSRRLSPDRVLLESERGYNTTLPDPKVAVRRELIFAAGKFVATPLEVGLRIGGAAEFAGLDAPANYKRSQALLTLAQRVLPGLDAAGGTHWMGHRPATPDSLPVIGTSPRLCNLVYAFGHGHLGLTQAAPTGRLIAELVMGDRPSLDLDPFSIARFT